METDKEFEVKTGSKSYVLMTNEYFGVASPRYMLIRSELKSDTGSTLFLLGVDVLLISMKYVSIPREEVTKLLYSAATESIALYIEANGFVEGNTYYGEYLQDEAFEIGIEKPSWEDGNWGQKLS